MGNNECSQPASKSSWDSQDFGDASMVLKWPILASPPGHNELREIQTNPGNEITSHWHTVPEKVAHHSRPRLDYVI